MKTIRLKRHLCAAFAIAGTVIIIYLVAFPPFGFQPTHAEFGVSESKITCSSPMAAGPGLH